MPKDCGREGEAPFQLSPEAVPFSSVLYKGVLHEKVSFTYKEFKVTRRDDLLLLTFINSGLLRLGTSQRQGPCLVHVWVSRTFWSRPSEGRWRPLPNCATLGQLLKLSEPHLMRVCMGIGTTPLALGGCEFLKESSQPSPWHIINAQQRADSRVNG